MKTSIVVVDDHAIVREGLLALLERESDFDVIGEATNGHDAVRLARELQPDVVVMDISMPDLNGVEASHRIKEQAPQARIIALSMHTSQQFINKMFCAGVSAYVVKSGAFDDLAVAIRRSRRNETFMSQSVTDIVVQNYVHNLARPDRDGASPLTTREREVLQLIAEGNATKAIAESLHVSVNTIDTHRRHIMQKLNRRSVAKLTKYAINEGITSLED